VREGLGVRANSRPTTTGITARRAGVCR
jgi:hypothetical protein